MANLRKKHNLKSSKLSTSAVTVTSAAKVKAKAKKCIAQSRLLGRILQVNPDMVPSVSAHMDQAGLTPLSVPMVEELPITEPLDTPHASDSLTLRSDFFSQDLLQLPKYPCLPDSLQPLTVDLSALDLMHASLPYEIVTGDESPAGNPPVMDSAQEMVSVIMDDDSSVLKPCKKVKIVVHDSSSDSDEPMEVPQIQSGASPSTDEPLSQVVEELLQGLQSDSVVEPAMPPQDSSLAPGGLNLVKGSNNPT